MIRLTSFLWLWFQCVCPLIPSCNTYRLTCVSLTLDVGYLFMAAPVKCSCCSLPSMRGISSPPLFLTFCPWPQTWGSSSRPHLCAIAAAQACAPLQISTKQQIVKYCTLLKKKKKVKSYLVSFALIIGEENGNPLQYSCLENPMDREAWQAMVHRFAKSWTHLKQLSMHTQVTSG